MKKEKCFDKILIFIILILLLIFSINSASSQIYQVKVTNEHPFLLLNGEYVPASKLQEGMELKTINGKRARITKITDVVLDSPVNVYNLDTEKYDDFVLPGGVVVHNSNRLYADVNSPKARRIRANEAGFTEEFLSNPNSIESGKTNWDIINNAHNIKETNSLDPAALQEKYNYLADHGFSKDKIKYDS